MKKLFVGFLLALTVSNTSFSMQQINPKPTGNRIAALSGLPSWLRTLAYALEAQGLNIYYIGHHWIWQPRIQEHSARTQTPIVKAQNISEDTFTDNEMEDLISQAGDLIPADEMQDLEETQSLIIQSRNVDLSQLTYPPSSAVPTQSNQAPATYNSTAEPCMYCCMRFPECDCLDRDKFLMSLGKPCQKSEATPKISYRDNATSASGNLESNDVSDLTSLFDAWHLQEEAFDDVFRTDMMRRFMHNNENL